MQRKKEVVVQHRSRFRPALHARLMKAADKHGATLNEEIVLRLERSLTRDDALGGPDVSRVATLMAAAFAMSAGRKNVDDPDRYRAGVIGVIRALMAQWPQPIARLDLEAIVGTIYSPLTTEQKQEDTLCAAQ